MKKEEFLEDLAEVFEVDKDTLLNEFEWSPDNWDSLAIVSTIALVDQYFNVTLEVEDFIGTTSLEEFMGIIQKKTD